ncbi:G-protein coupled receptor family C group 5 member C-like [Hemitrygon akajei]|uniref:G-protein coupled receptor family C group 5 member C-like n=1 Tax=Hemitrygon akajei TaxID=2704970 RepID=UPI003BF98187
MARAPAGCRRDLNWIYHSLCNLKEGWGILVEALAVAGLALGAGLTVALLALTLCSRGRSSAARWKALSLPALRVMLAAGAWGCLALSFAFVVKPHADNCAARRFLLGAVPALCFASLCVQAGLLLRRGGGTTSPLCLLAALTLFLVECLIKAVWLITSTVRARPLKSVPGQNPCSVAKSDLVGSLVYVMVLLATGLVLSLAALLRLLRRGPRRRRREAGYLLVAAALSAAVWVSCLAAYLRGERRPSWIPYRDAWDDSPLAALLLANGWALLACCLLPWVLEAWRVWRRGEEDEDETDNEGRESLGVSEVGSADNKSFQPEAGKLKSRFEDVQPMAMLKLESIPRRQEQRLSTVSNPQYRMHFL